LGKFMAKRRHFSRTHRGPGENSPGSADTVVRGKIFNGPRLEEEAAGDAPWNGVRSNKVRQARQLVEDRNYPPAEVLQSVAGLLAKHLPAGR
jgi:hypothetical protein